MGERLACANAHLTLRTNEEPTAVAAEREVGRTGNIGALEGPPASRKSSATDQTGTQRSIARRNVLRDRLAVAIESLDNAGVRPSPLRKLVRLDW